MRGGGSEIRYGVSPGIVWREVTALKIGRSKAHEFFGIVSRQASYGVFVWSDGYHLCLRGGVNSG